MCSMCVCVCVLCCAVFFFLCVCVCVRACAPLCASVFACVHAEQGRQYYDRIFPIFQVLMDTFLWISYWVYWCIHTSQLPSPSLSLLIQQSQPEPLGQPETTLELQPCGNPHSDTAGWTPADDHSSHKLLTTNCKWQWRMVDATAMGDLKCERCALFVIVK